MINEGLDEADSGETVDGFDLMEKYKGKYGKNQ